MLNKINYILAAVALVLICIVPVNAASFIQTNLFLLGEDAVLNDDLWLSADTVEIKGRVKNDLFLMAMSKSWKKSGEQEGHILLAGQLENDVWAFGNSITLTGIINDHARLLASLITVNGSVSNSSVLAGNLINLTPTARMARDVLIFGENVIVEGNVGGNLTVFSKSVTLAGTCAGNVRITAGDIVVLPKSKIAGDLIYNSPSELILDKNVVLQGHMIREEGEISKTEHKPLVSWPSLFLQSWLFIGALCAGALMLFLFPAFLNESVSQIKYLFWKCLATGFVAVCLVPVACFFLAISLVGLPLAILTAMVLAVSIYLSKIIVALFIGGLIVHSLRQGFKVFPAMGLGLVLLYAAAGSGLVGGIFSFLIACLGLGGMILASLARRTAHRD